MTTTPPPPAPPSPSPRRRAGRLPPPPPGVRVLTRPEAAAFMGVSLGTFGLWERAGRVTIPRYRQVQAHVREKVRKTDGGGRVGGGAGAIFYAQSDLERLREEFAEYYEPSPPSPPRPRPRPPGPQHPGVASPRPRPRRRPGPLPPPPPGVEVFTRPQAAAFMGRSLAAFFVWECEGRVTIPRYRQRKADVPGKRGVGGLGAIYYARADLERLREEFRKLEEPHPHPDPEYPGVYRVPVHRHHETLFALIDAEDLPKVVGKRWNVRGGIEKQWGGACKQRGLEVILANATERNVPLKRLIMGLDGIEHKQTVVATVNGDPLDCRRANLVIKTRTEVNLTKRKPAGRLDLAATSKYRGVSWDFKRRLWKAQIGTRELHRQLGRFRDEAQAAAAYDEAVRAMYGEGGAAPLNFPDGIIPAPTFLGPDGAPVREKNKYRVPRGLQPPPPGEAILTRQEAADMLEVSTGTLGIWEREGQVVARRYRVKAHTGTPILYAADDVARLREKLDKVGQPYPDPHPARAGTWRVPLRTLAGYIEALIDEADLPIVRGKKWNFVQNTGGGTGKKGGIVTQVGPRDTPHLQLKRLILGLHGREERLTTRITHANGNPLDCRRINLVLDGPDKCTRRSFKLLHRCGRPTTSRYKGVAWLEREGLWQAQIRIDDKPKRLGLFDDELDAAHTYDQAAREVWGLEARVNFPRPGELPSAAAPVAPADLWPDAQGPAAKLPGKPTDFSAVLNQDGSVTLSWRSTNAAASAGVTFAVLRRLPGQREFMRIGTAAGTTSMARRPTFTDATVPAEHLAAQGEGDGGVRYIVQGARALCGAMGTGEASDVVLVRLGAEASTLTLATLAEAA